jgi:hypothetical protein
MITEYPPEHRRYDQPECERLWAAAALDLPLSLHTATRRQGKIRGAGPGTLRDASSRGDKGVLSGAVDVRSDLLGVFERHPRLTLAIVEFELAWAPPPALHHGLHLEITMTTFVPRLWIYHNPRLAWREYESSP